jgi:DNA-binding transcriptional MerR regulator
MDSSHQRRLTIGEYAAATQLTAKALRLYEEHGLLTPSSVDPATGYRYYQFEQVATGRLVRTLREMNLSLAQIGQVLGASRGLQPTLLREFLREAEQRLAHERTAYQSALLMLRSHAPSTSTTVEERETSRELVALFTFTTNRTSFVEHALQMLSTHSSQLRAYRTKTQTECAFALLEPLTDEDARVELAIPIDVDATLNNVTTRLVSARRYATVVAPPAALVEGFTSCVDALFDWFDRKGIEAVGNPEVVFCTDGDELGTLVRWAFKADDNS